MKHLNPQIRISLYLAVAAVGAALVVWGVVTQELVDAILPTVAGVLAVSGGATAVRNITPAPRDEGPGALEWAGIGRDTLPVILDEIRELRAAVNAQTFELAETSPPLTPTDPVVAAELARTSTGRHRMDGAQ